LALVLSAATAVADAPPPEDPVPAGLTRAPEAGDAAPATGDDADAPEILDPGVPRALPEAEPSVRLRLRKVAWDLTAAFDDVPGRGRFQTVAVLPFLEHGEETERRRIGTLVSAELATFLRRDHGLWLVERSRIEEALVEAYLSETGITDPDSAVRLGELLAAQALVVGEVSAAGEAFLVNVRIVGTETGEVLVAEQASLPAADLVSYASEAVVLRTQSAAVFRSVLIPGWGQFYNRQPAKGWSFIGTEGILLGGALTLHLAGQQSHARYVETGDLLPYDQAVRLLEARNVVLIVAGVVWAYNVLDAWLNGVTFDPARHGWEGE
jgi:TolB-like protein